MVIPSPLPGPSTCKLIETKFKCSGVYFCLILGVYNLNLEAINTNISHFNAGFFTAGVQCYSWGVKFANGRGRN